MLPNAVPEGSGRTEQRAELGPPETHTRGGPRWDQTNGKRSFPVWPQLGSERRPARDKIRLIGAAAAMSHHVVRARVLLATPPVRPLSGRAPEDTQFDAHATNAEQIELDPAWREVVEMLREVW